MTGDEANQASAQAREEVNKVLRKAHAFIKDHQDVSIFTGEWQHAGRFTWSVDDGHENRSLHIGVKVR
jgi:hypothetical protein